MSQTQSNIKMTAHFMFGQMFLGTCMIIVVLSCGVITVEADDEVPAFFLKIAKNVPRIGRSDKYHEYFLKQAKNVPRMGKREDYDQMVESFYDREPFAQRQRRMVNHASTSGLDSSAWGHFPLAIEGPPELWRALASYANDRYGTSGVNEINNDVWSRDKRSTPASP